jgi:hypothetical protein
MGVDCLSIDGFECELSGWSEVDVADRQAQDILARKTSAA